jgi:hypothetical protein
MAKSNELPSRPIWQLADQFKERRSLSEAEEQSAGTFLRTIADVRRHPRHKIDVEIRINSRTCGFLKGRTVDISESGIAAMLTIEAPLGEVVELSFTLPFGPLAIHAMARQRSAFRYGFEFVDSSSVHRIIHSTCRELAQQSMVSPDTVSNLDNRVESISGRHRLETVAHGLRRNSGTQPQ